MKKNCFLLLSYLLCINSYAQDTLKNENPKNVIHASFGTILFVSSAQLTYDRLLKQRNDGFFKSYYLTLKTGASAFGGFGGSGGGLVNSIGVTALTGNGNEHFELGLGLGYYVETYRLDDRSSDGDKFFYPNFAIGYRKQTQNGFMFRTGVGFVEMVYAGIGYSF